MLATIRRPTASQPLSTEERIGVSAAPVGGHCVSFAPVRWSYQLKNWPLSPSRSMPSSVVSVRAARSRSSRLPMIPSRSAATALHRYAPMFVVDVCTSRRPSANSWSVGRPDAGSVIAAIDAHVPAA